MQEPAVLAETVIFLVWQKRSAVVPVEPDGGPRLVQVAVLPIGPMRSTVPRRELALVSEENRLATVLVRGVSAPVAELAVTKDDLGIFGVQTYRIAAGSHLENRTSGG
ncbi:MAG: hypothetical protein ACRD1X_17955 [Vicinamibacteria bacterium]